MSGAGDGNLRERAASRVVYVLLGLIAFVVIAGVLGNILRPDIRMEVAGLGLLTGAVVTIVIGKNITTRS